MRSSRLAIGSCLFLILLAACAPPPPPDLREVAKTQLFEREAAFVETARNRDVEGFVGFFAEDAAVFPKDGPARQGLDAVRSEWGSLLENPDARITWLPLHAEASRSGDLGYTWGTWEITMTVPDGPSTTKRGKYVTQWRREGDGPWLVVADIGSTDEPSEPQ